MVNNLHIAVLFDPQLTHDDIMDTARRIGPSECFLVSVPKKNAFRNLIDYMYIGYISYKQSKQQDSQNVLWCHYFFI